MEYAQYRNKTWVIDIPATIGCHGIIGTIQKLATEHKLNIGQLLDQYEYDTFVFRLPVIPNAKTLKIISDGFTELEELLLREGFQMNWIIP